MKLFNICPFCSKKLINKPSNTLVCSNNLNPKSAIDYAVSHFWQELKISKEGEIIYGELYWLAFDISKYIVEISFKNFTIDISERLDKMDYGFMKNIVEDPRL